MKEDFIILIAALDDNKPTGYLIEHGLTNAGFDNIKGFSDYKELIEYAHDSNVRIILLDHFIDEVTGYEVMLEVKKINSFCRFIIMTGLSDIAEWRKYLRQRVWDIVPKDDNFIPELILSVKSLEADIRADMEYFSELLEK